MGEAESEQEAAPAPAGQTAGSLLREAREAAGASLPALAAALKVPLAKLEALERDDYGYFQDYTFLRALAMTVCRSLRIEPAPIMALLPRLEPKSLAGTAGINATYKERNFKGSGTPLRGSGQSSRKIILGVLVILIAAAVLYFVPLHQEDSGSSNHDVANTNASDSGAASAAASAGGATAAGTVVESTNPAAGGVAQPGTDGAANTATASTATTPATALPGSAASTTAAAAGLAASGTDNTAAATPVAGEVPLLQLSTQTQSWVRVKDVNGKVVLEKTLGKGESVTAQGQLPLSVTVGNAKGTQVMVRGEPLDISTTRDNVARFEVK